MAKKVKAILKLNLQAGAANPAPPTGPALGQHGVNIMDFVNQYNQKTKEMRGQVIPALVTIYQDKSFTFTLRMAPVAEMIKQTLKIKLGSTEPGKKKAGSLTLDQAKEIAQKKLPDMNTPNLDSAIQTIIGTAKSMGIAVKK